MRYLIINADDFGYSQGINCGIIEAHSRGIVTSTSVMVDGVAAEQAHELINYENLSIGLHLVITDSEHIEEELDRQINKFISIVGRKPDHIDTHKSQPDAKEEVKQVLKTYAGENNMPVRSFGDAKLIKSFFGLNIDGSGKLNENNVSFAAFTAAINQATDEYNELMCHVGYSDDFLRQLSSYNDIRENELKVLTSPEAREYVREQGLTLCSWRDVRYDKIKP